MTQTQSPFHLPSFKTYNEAYYAILQYIHENGDEVAAGGSHQRELSAAGFSVQDTENMIAPVREMSFRYAVAELIWYWAGSNSLEWISHFSTFWKNISDDERTSNSAYGYLLHKKWGFDQVDMVKKELIKDMYSRRATIKINTPRTPIMGDNKDLSETKDEWCTLSLQFLIRDNKLNMITNMRSNDLEAGLPYDAVYFTSIQKHLVKELKETYPSLTVGSYTHFVGSIHEYERSFDKNTKRLQDHDISEKSTLNIDVLGVIRDAKKLYDQVQLQFGVIKNDKDLRHWFDETILNNYVFNVESGKTLAETKTEK